MSLKRPLPRVLLQYAFSFALFGLLLAGPGTIKQAVLIIPIIN